MAGSAGYLGTSISLPLFNWSDQVDEHRFYERLGWDKSHAGFKLVLAD
ncbi:MAG: hypothetical protein WC804_09130 [Sphingomonas sp.]